VDIFDHVTSIAIASKKDEEPAGHHSSFMTVTRARRQRLHFDRSVGDTA